MVSMFTAPNYTDVHNRWIQYFDSQISNAEVYLRSCCHSFDVATWSFYHQQIDQVVKSVEKNASHYRKMINLHKISR